MTKDITAEHVLNDLRYLTLLARSFPTVADASTEIINLEAILNLPKGTEHFLSDIHGEHQAFNHVLKNASGAIKRKVNEIFSNTLRDFEKKELCTLIYYPEQKLELIRQREKDLDDWYLITLNQLVRVCRNVSSKYTRSKVRKALPKEFSYIIQELLHESSDEPNKSAYVDQIINTIISTGRANDFIIAMCNLIQRLTIDLLHIIGDIYDRGPGAHIIMDTLCNYHNFDIQWGNHDILWMGAAAGNAGSIANKNTCHEQRETERSHPDIDNQYPVCRQHADIQISAAGTRSPRRSYDHAHGFRLCDVLDRVSLHGKRESAVERLGDAFCMRPLRSGDQSGIVHRRAEPFFSSRRLHHRHRRADLRPAAGRRHTEGADHPEEVVRCVHGGQRRPAACLQLHACHRQHQQPRR